jgi:hypothetical protein
MLQDSVTEGMPFLGVPLHAQPAWQPHSFNPLNDHRCADCLQVAVAHALQPTLTQQMAILPRECLLRASLDAAQKLTAEGGSRQDIEQRLQQLAVLAEIPRLLSGNGVNAWLHSKYFSLESMSPLQELLRLPCVEAALGAEMGIIMQQIFRFMVSHNRSCTIRTPLAALSVQHKRIGVYSWCLSFGSIANQLVTAWNGFCFSTLCTRV